MSVAMGLVTGVLLVLATGWTLLAIWADRDLEGPL